LTDKVVRAFKLPCFDWQSQDVSSLSKETDLRSCNNQVLPFS